MQTASFYEWINWSNLLENIFSESIWHWKQTCLSIRIKDKNVPIWCRSKNTWQRLDDWFKCVYFGLWFLSGSDFDHFQSFIQSFLLLIYLLAPQVAHVYVWRVDNLYEKRMYFEISAICGNLLQKFLGYLSTFSKWKIIQEWPDSFEFV